MRTKSEGEIATYVSTLLNDMYPGNENVRWPLDLVKKAYHEAVSVISMLRPDLSTEYAEVDLQAGVVQHAPDGCASIIKVVGAIDPKTGVVMEVANKADINLSKWFTDDCGPLDGSYKMSSYSLDDDNASVFLVTPPVSLGQSGKVLVMCSGMCNGSASRIDCRFETPIVEFMMYRLLSTEDDSVTSVQGATSHLNTFVRLLNLNKQSVDELLKDGSNVVAAPEG